MTKYKSCILIIKISIISNCINLNKSQTVSKWLFFIIKADTSISGFCFRKRKPALGDRTLDTTKHHYIGVSSCFSPHTQGVLTWNNRPGGGEEAKFAPMSQTSEWIWPAAENLSLPTCFPHPADSQQHLFPVNWKYFCFLRRRLLWILKLATPPLRALLFGEMIV